MNRTASDETNTLDGRPRWWMDYVAAAIALAIATIVRLSLDPLLGSDYPFVTYFVALTIVAWFGRTRTAIVTLVVGGVLTFSLFAPRGGSVWLGAVLYIMVASAIVAMSHAMRQARGRAETLRADAVVQQDALRSAVVAEREQRELLRTTLASIGDAVITTDPAGRVTLLNPAAEVLIGWTNAEAAGLPLATVCRILDEDTRQPVGSPAERAHAAGSAGSRAHRSVLVGRDGVERPVDDSSAPILGARNEVLGFVLVFRDLTDRRQLDRARLETQQQVAATLESVTDGFIRYDKDWRIVYVNAEAERINRLDRSEMLGRVIWKLFPAVMGTTLERELRRAMAERVTVEFENRYEPFGRWYSLKAYPAADGGLTAFIRDITEQKAQQDALVASEARFRELADAMPQIVYSSDADGLVDFSNLQWREYTGQDGAQTYDLAPVVHPDDLDVIVRKWEQAREAGLPLDVEFRLRRASDGAYRWFLTRSVPMRNAAGHIERWFGTSTDIDDQKRIAQQLAESEARYRAIGESIDFGVWVCDATGRNTYASESYLRVVGLTQAQCSDFGWGDVLHPDDAAATVAAWKECVRTQGSWDREHRFRGADGQWYHVLARGVPLRDAAGTVLGWAGINLDVTRLVQAERDMARVSAGAERQRRLYETVLTNTPDFVYVFSLDYTIMYANDALLTMWGYGKDEAIGRRFLELGYEPWHAEMHEREIDQVRATREPIRGLVPFRGTHGLRQYEYIFVPVIGADGEVEAVAGTTRDVTDRLMAEERMRATEDRQTFLITLADTIRPLADPVAVQTEANRLLGERLRANRVVYFEVRDGDFIIEREYRDGVSPLVGRYPLASFGADLLATYLAGLTAVGADVEVDESMAPAEREAFRAIGARAWVGVPLIKDGRFVAGMAVHSATARHWTPTELAIIEDTAERTWAAVERVRAEEALRTSEERFRTVFSTMDEGFCVIEVDFDQAGRAIDYRIEMMNAAFENHTGMHGLAGQSIRQAIPGLEDFWFETYGRVATSGEPARLVHQAAAMEGRWFDVSAFRLGGPGSRKAAVLFNDITDRKRDEAEREHLLSQLKGQDRRKDEFLATLAHELRNPLAPISNGLQLIRLAGSHGMVEDARSMMERQLVQMTRLVDDLLDAGRVTTGKLELRRERLTMQAVVTAAVETSRPVILQHGHRLDVMAPDAPIVVDGDPIRLAQMLSNLLTNSAKYTHRGGHIQLSVSQQGEEAVLSVADDGIGIPPDMLDAVFEMFTQVDRTLEKTTGGLGIGLSLVKGLVEMHGGTIEARSEGEGRGSEFVVRLPIAAPATSDGHGNGAAPIGSAPSRTYRILIVDDNVDFAESLGLILGMMGHDVRTVHDGEAGVATARGFQPTLVLCDIGMPKMNGYDVARRIRTEAWAARSVLVALTGWGQDSDLQRSTDAGFDHHLVKPVEPAVLLQLLASVEPT